MFLIKHSAAERYQPWLSLISPLSTEFPNVSRMGLRAEWFRPICVHCGRVQVHVQGKLALRNQGSVVPCTRAGVTQRRGHSG